MDLFTWRKVRFEPNGLIEVSLIALVRCVQAGLSGLENSVDAFP